MKRLAIILLLAAAPVLAVTAPDERCSGIVDVRGLPLVELPSPRSSNQFAIMLTGDGGWRRIDQKITDHLRADGVPIVGFVASDYFRQRRTPEQAACALERVIRYYQINWHREKVILIGYSRGADVLPFMVSRLPQDVRASVSLVALLGLEPMIDFKYNPPWTLASYFGHEPQYPVKPEVEKLRGTNVLCVFGEKEKQSLCHQLDPTAFTIMPQPGGHHFAGKYRDIGEAILANARQP